MHHAGLSSSAELILCYYWCRRRLCNTYVLCDCVCVCVCVCVFRRITIVKLCQASIRFCGSVTYETVWNDWDKDGFGAPLFKQCSEETRTLRAGCSKAESKISPCRRPLSWGAGRPKFYPLQMVYVQTQFGEDRCMQFLVIVVTDRPTNTHTHIHPHTNKHRQDRLQYSAAASLVCSVIKSFNKYKFIVPSTARIDGQHHHHSRKTVGRQLRYHWQRTGICWNSIFAMWWFVC